jgi:uncharacterized membrane protein YraQ (UPF0718 family)
MVSLLVESLYSGLNELYYYLTEHTLNCLIPAFFIAGAIAVFVSGPAVLKYFGARTKKYISYSVASVSGVILAVCSCTVLPLFAGIHRKGAGLGPAITFLYSGPAINLLAIVLTARVLGFQLGVARAVAAVVFAIVIGLLMALLFRKEELGRQGQQADNHIAATAEPEKPLGQTVIFIGLLVAVLLVGTARIDLLYKLAGVAFLIGGVVFTAFKWYTPDENRQWMHETWKLFKLIFPMLLIGVFIAGIIKVMLPPEYIARWVGGNSVQANLLASTFGMLMYFSTLTEVPILSAFMEMGMGKGPALALLLAGPALSLPSLLAIRNVLGTKKTLVYAGLVVVMATVSGIIFGSLPLGG